MHYAIRDFMHKSLLPESGSPSCYALGAGMHYQLMHYKQVYCTFIAHATHAISHRSLHFESVSGYYSSIDMCLTQRTQPTLMLQRML